MRWERRGRALVLTTDEGERFRLFLDGRREPLPPGRDPARVGHPDSSGRSDNGSVAYLSSRDRNGRSCFQGYDGGWECTPNSELYLGLASGRGVRVTHTRVEETDLTWSPDGRTLVFSSGGRLWLVDSDGTHLRQLTGPGS